MPTETFKVLLDDPSWSIAKAIVNSSGNFENILTKCTKTLERLSSNNSEQGSTSLFLMKRLVASREVRAKFIYALLTLSPDKTDLTQGKRGSEIIKIFTPNEISALCACIFAYSLIKKITPSQHLPDIEKDVQEFGEIGMLCGHAFSQVGTAKGLIIGILRPLAFATLSKKFPEEFEKYKLTLKKNALIFDLELEAKAFKCQHSQICSLLAQKLGFQLSFTREIYLAMNSSISAVNGEAKQLRSLNFLIDSLATKKGLVSAESKECIALGEPKENSTQILTQAANVPVTGSLHGWMTRGEKDLTPANSPDLFENSVAPLFDADVDFKSVSDAVRQAFSFEDFASFRSAIIDILGNNEDS
jgi:hypothetical protein